MEFIIITTQSLITANSDFDIDSSKFSKKSFE